MASQSRLDLPNLRRLEDNGLIASQKVENKRLFTLTEAGHSERDRQPSPQPPWEEVTEGLDPVVMRLGQALEELSEAAMHLAQAGTEGQQAKALEVLAGVRHRLYSILAEKA